jgi:hypothetical protein
MSDPRVKRGDVLSNITSLPNLLTLMRILLIPVFVVITGLLFILRGMGLGIPYMSPKPVTELVSSDVECH